MKQISTYAFFLLCFIAQVKTDTLQSQIIVRLVEAELSATANVIALTTVKEAERGVNKEIKKLNRQIRQKTPYYGLMSVFRPMFQIDNTIVRIRQKLLSITRINNAIPRLFNRKRNKRRDKILMYTNYLYSIESDVGVDFSNNGNLLKTCLEIVSELEEVEKDLDNMLEDLTIAQRFFVVFQTL